jgi:hypothetical protein
MTRRVSPDGDSRCCTGSLSEVLFVRRVGVPGMLFVRQVGCGAYRHHKRVRGKRAREARDTAREAGRSKEYRPEVLWSLPLGWHELGRAARHRVVVECTQQVWSNRRYGVVGQAKGGRGFGVGR